MGGARGGDHGGKPVSLDPHQLIGGQSLDLRHHQMRPFLLHHGAQGLGVGHVDDMGAVGNLGGGRVGISVHRNGLHTQALQFEHHFLAQFAGA